MPDSIVRVIDLETTGMEPPAEVIEAAYCDLHLDGDQWTVHPPTAWLCGVASVPPETRAVHHITAAEVAGLPPFAAADLLAPDVTVIAAHNIKFEIGFLSGVETPPHLCTFKAALRVWPDAPGHSNGVLRYWLEDHGLLDLDRDAAMPPHRAGPDAYVTAHILRALFAAGATGREMVGWTREPELLPRCPIGKFRGKPWPEVEIGFLDWMTRQKDMEQDLKWNAWREINRRRGESA